MSERDVRAYARSGLLEAERDAGGAYRFSFRDLVLLRTARSLREADVPHRRIRRALEKLRGVLPHDSSLSELRVSAVGGEVVVHDAFAAWSPGSGQIQLDFEVAALEARLHSLDERRAATSTADTPAGSGSSDANAWFERGLQLEADAPDEARRAYLRALEIEPNHTNALVNLGRLLHERGDLAGAAERYRRVLSLHPDHATASFNLGVALEDMGRPTEAVDAYRAALDADPSLADAHYNLAGLYERRGDRTAAIRHLRSYRSLASGS